MKMRAKKGTGDTKMRTQRCVFVLLICCLAGWLLSTGAFAAEPVPGGTLKFGTENDFAGFEALKSGSRLAINGSIAANTIMEPLFRMDADENLIPVLALSMDQADDGKAWIIKLRRQVRFHDGTPFDADAVVHHWRRLLDPANKYRARAAMAPITGITKIDAYTVRFDLKHAWLPFARVISSTRSLARSPTTAGLTTHFTRRSHRCTKRITSTSLR